MSINETMQQKTKIATKGIIYETRGKYSNTIDSKWGFIRLNELRKSGDNNFHGRFRVSLALFT